MENTQMGMPAAPSSPESAIVFDQMRQQVSPKEFSDEMLAGASQVDPQAVAQFKKELDALDVPPDVLDALNNLVDEILANPANYAEIRKKYMDQGIPEDILPEQFDPHFFAALNMAIDQMVGAPAGPQAFAKGGIAELKPIAKAIAGYGRNGDTMLAHITPAEARMLKRRGGSGTINPATGLPEFFNLFKAIGKAVKSFVNSTVGRIVTTVALGFFLGPAAAGLVGIESAAGVAAMSGFVGSAGATLLGGGSIRDALKAGAVGGLTAGAVGGVTQGFNTPYTGPTTVGGQWDKLTGTAPVAPEISATGQVANTAPVPGQPTVPGAPQTVPGGAPAAVSPETAAQGAPLPAAQPSLLDATAQEGSLAKLNPTAQPSMLDQAKDFYSKNISPSGIQEQGIPAAQNAGTKAVSDLVARVPDATPAMKEAAYQTAYKAAMPGMLSTYGPMAAAGMGIMGLAGGFSPKAAPDSGLKSQLMKPATQRIADEGTQRQFYVQGLPGVKYDTYGAPIYGQSSPLPTVGSGSYNNQIPASIGGLPSLAMSGTTYFTPPGAIGNPNVFQPYNTADMYPNLMLARGYARGGDVTAGSGTSVNKTTISDLYKSVLNRTPSPSEIEGWQATFGDTDIGELQRAQFNQAAQTELTQRANQQQAARDAVAQQKALKKAQGYGTAYANMNAGLAALAPEQNPGQVLSASRQAEISNALKGLNDPNQIFATASQYGLTPNQLASTFVNANGGSASQALGNINQWLADNNKQLPGVAITPDRIAQIQNAYNTAAQTAAAQQRPVTDASHYQVAQQGGFAPAELAAAYPSIGYGGVNRILGRGAMQTAYAPMLQGQQGFRAQQAAKYAAAAARPTAAGAPKAAFGMNTGGIAALAQGGYPRMNGQISGPGTEKSDSIPAMLSDGEFVMTAKAVRGAGNGSRREGAKKMYKLMHQLERNAQRG